jgi:hypothetical protein
MDPFEWVGELFRTSPAEGGVGGGTPGAWAIGQWAAEVPYLGPFLGAYLAGREDLSSLTPGDEGYARSEVYERATASAPWRRVSVGSPVEGLPPGTMDFTGSVSWKRSDASTLLGDAPDAGIGMGNRRGRDLRNPNLLADNQDHKIVVETSMSVVARGGELGGRPELKYYSRQEWGPTTYTAAPPAPDEVIVRGVRPDRSAPFRGTPSGIPPGFVSLIDLPSNAVQGWGRRESSPATEFRPERDPPPQDERSFSDRDGADRGAVSKWLYEDSKGIPWYVAPMPGDWIAQSHPVDTGNTLENYAINAWLGLSNLTASAVNTVPELGTVLDKAMMKSRFSVEWQNWQMMGPMMKTMGLGAGLAGGLRYLRFRISSSTRLQTLALQPVLVLLGSFGPAPNKLASTKALAKVPAIRLPSPGETSFTSQTELREALGTFERTDWHHIVEQHSANIAKFGAQAIHNTKNLVPVPRHVHTAITAFYSSAIREGGPTYRAVLKTWGFQEQHDFGLRVLKFFEEQ